MRLVKEAFAGNSTAETRDTVCAVKLPLEFVVVRKFIACGRVNQSAICSWLYLEELVQAYP